MKNEEPDSAGNRRPRDLEATLSALRPKLHRYCARMTGSVIDGEDVLQDALAKALTAMDESEGEIRNFEAWLFRIAHNASLDHLRRWSRQSARLVDLEVEEVEDTAAAADQRATAAASLRTFMRLSPTQRSSVILADVLGFSLKEVVEAMDATLASAKSTLHRGRARLRELSLEPEEIPIPALSAHEERLLRRYVDRFNARDFDAIRQMISEEVRLEMVNRKTMRGRSEVSSYFGNYERAKGWAVSLGFVDGTPAVLMHDPLGMDAVWTNFVLLKWSGDVVVGIRDFRYATYTLADAEIVTAKPIP